MKNLKLVVIAFLLIPALFLTSCDRGDDLGTGTGTITPAFTLLKDYMVANQLDLNNILAGPGDVIKFVVGAPADVDLDAFLDKYYILDIRSGDAFNSGHIQGANNIAFADILTEAGNANGQPILMVCYTGQTACYATSLLRMYGYDDTQALKWGMSGWSPATAGSWNGNIGDIAEGNSNWTYASAPSNQIFGDPTVSSLSQDGYDILMDRIEDVVAGGFKTASNADVLATPSNYFVNNYFGAADYSAFGHVSNAYRVKEELLLVGDGYLAMDPDSNTKIVSYCYTGQTSAVVTAWLNVLGYDAYSLTFGMNGLYNSNSAWVTNKWSASVSKNLPLVN
ncbi:MAG: rhodanese-like domain-containing protein [Flavobacteriaceae bacterium]